MTSFVQSPINIGYHLNQITMGYVDGKIDIRGLPARSIILARSAPYCNALYRIGNDMSYFSRVLGDKSAMESIVSIFKFRNDNLNLNWARFTLVSNQTEIKFQMNPNLKQLANFKLSGVGRYGKQVLDMLKIFTTPTPEKTLDICEASLAKLMINAMKSGQGITENDLINAGLSVGSPQRGIGCLNKFIHLIGVEETQRRLYPFCDKEMEFDALPMGIAITMALQLIAIKKLSFSQVFNKDKKNFGPFTSDTINSEAGVKLFYEKMDCLVFKYFEHFPETPFSKEGMHQLLRSAFGGDADSDGETYDSDEEESEIKIDLLTAVSEHKTRIVKKLLQRPIDFNEQDSQGNTALHLAVKNNFIDIVDLLLKAKADFDICDKSGHYPLYYANSDEHFLIYGKLTNAGANKIQKEELFHERINKYGESILHIEIEAGNRALYLHLIDRLTIKMLNLPDHQGLTALHLLVKKRDVEACEKMLHSCINVSEDIVKVVNDNPSTHRIHAIFSSFGYMKDTPGASNTNLCL